MPARAAQNQKNTQTPSHTAHTTAPEADHPPGAPTTGAERSAAQTTTFIAQLCGELAGLAQTVNQDTLAYFLAMAQEEAEQITRDLEQRR